MVATKGQVAHLLLSVCFIQVCVNKGPIIIRQRSFILSNHRVASYSMHINDENGTKRKNFELPGSRAHYAPSLSFTINHMQLQIEPDFQTRTISCQQTLSIIAL